jgi:hypothetical protein
MIRNVSNFVVSSLEAIAVIGFLLFPVGGLLGGLGSGGPVGGIVGLFVATVVGVVVFGALFLFIQNNQTLKEIRDLLKAKQ